VVEPDLARSEHIPIRVLDRLETAIHPAKPRIHSRTDHHAEQIRCSAGKAASVRQTLVVRRAARHSRSRFSCKSRLRMVLVVPARAQADVPGSYPQCVSQTSSGEPLVLCVPNFTAGGSESEGLVNALVGTLVPLAGTPGHLPTGELNERVPCFLAVRTEVP
jgi:hypothetical protein